MRLNHVALTVADREVSAAFYGRFFGLTRRIHEDDHLLILAGPGGGILALSEGVVPPAPPRTTHFGFQAADADAVRAARAAFAEAGICEVEWEPDGTIRVQVLDPDGYRVDVFAI